MSAETDAAKAALSNYKQANSADVISNANQQYGVNDSQTRLSALKGVVDNLQSSVEAVDPSVTGRTSGTFTTEGQRQALVSKERAPILSNLSKQQSAYSSEQGNLTQKQALASQMASALISDDRQKYQTLLDAYNRSNAADQAAEQKRQWEAQQAESTRRYEQDRQDALRAAAAKSAASSASAASANAPHSQQRNDGGFNFQNASGAAISARSYAALAGINFNSLLQQMANAGDKGAQDVLKNGTKSKYYYAVTWS